MKSLSESMRDFADQINSVLMERGPESIHKDEVQRNWTQYASEVDPARVKAITAKIFNAPADQVHVEINPHDYEESVVFFNYYSKEEAIQALQGYFSYTQKYQNFANFGIKGAHVRAGSISDSINPNAWVDLGEVHSVEEVLHKLPQISNGTITVTFDVSEDQFLDR
jgi:hypothetical protein